MSWVVVFSASVSMMMGSAEVMTIRVVTPTAADCQAVARAFPGAFDESFHYREGITTRVKEACHAEG